MGGRKNNTEKNQFLAYHLGSFLGFSSPLDQK